MSKRNSHGDCIKSSPDQTNNYRNSDDLKTKTNKEQEEKLKDPNKPLAKKTTGIQIRLGPLKSSVTTTSLSSSTTKPKLRPSSQSVAAAFNQSDDDEPEEMPPEAKMRMRNIGRNTPTSTGPNSFGKTKHGFCDVKKMFQKDMIRAMENANEDDNSTKK